jgi:hypothetical protein
MNDEVMEKVGLRSWRTLTMAKEINITIENKLVMEKRDMNVYHHSTRSAHLISHNNSITLPLRTSVEDDYLHISVVSGPGHLENKSLVNLPSWADFELSSQGNIIVAHSGDRTLLKIPPGPSTWQLKMTRSITSFINQVSDRVTIGDDRLEYS